MIVCGGTAENLSENYDLLGRLVRWLLGGAPHLSNAVLRQLRAAHPSLIARLVRHLKSAWAEVASADTARAHASKSRGLSIFSHAPKLAAEAPALTLLYQPQVILTLADQYAEMPHAPMPQKAMPHAPIRQKAMAHEARTRSASRS